MFVISVALIAHFIADFLLQSRDMAKNKSIDPYVLMDHCAIQWIVLTVCLWPFLGAITASEIGILNALGHGVIDWNIWKLYKWSVKKRHEPGHVYLGWEYWEDHWFYATIGLDQLLHGLTLIGVVAWCV